MSLWMPAPRICHTCASVTNPLATIPVAEGVDGFDGDATGGGFVEGRKIYVLACEIWVSDTRF